MQIFSILLAIIQALICLILGHNYNPATCTTPQTCLRCGEISGETLEHDYLDGKCINCEAIDPDYEFDEPNHDNTEPNKPNQGADKPSEDSNVFGVGETWIVNGEWEITINSATSHYLCNSYADEDDGYINNQVVTVSYTYKNLGLEDSLYLSTVQMDFYDGELETAPTYPCTHKIFPEKCIIGAKHTATHVMVLNNYSDEITINIELFDSVPQKQKAIFVIPITSNGGSATQSSDYTFSLINNDTAYTVTGLKNASLKRVIIPDVYNGKPVISISKEAFAESSIEEVIIGNNIETIEDGAFAYSTVSNVSFGPKTKLLGTGAFFDCDELTVITLSDSIEELGYNAFAECNNLEKVITGNNLKWILDTCFYNCPKLTSIVVKNQENAWMSSPWNYIIQPSQLSNDAYVAEMVSRTHPTVS